MINYMTDLADKTKSYEPERYRYAIVAAEFMEKKDVNSARKSLDKLMIDMGATDKDVQEGMVWNAYGNSPSQEMMQGIKRGIDIYASKYQGILGNKTINEMFERYMPEFDKYLAEEEKAKAKETFAKLGDKKYDAVSKEVRKNMKIIQDQDSTEDEKKKAQKELEKYADVYSTIQEFEELRISRLMPSIREGTIKINVQERYKVEKKEEGKK